MDKELIKSQVKEVIKYSQNFQEDPKVDDLIDQWFKNKKKFIDKMGGELIYEIPTPISFEINERDKIQNIEDFITETEINYCNNPNCNLLLEFLENCKKTFYQNKVPKDITYFLEDEEVVIPKGMKINKALKFFFKNRKDELTEIQNEVSRLIQKDKVNGILCISVHPLDFLSASETTYNWRSCHALDGEYRVGTLSYMTDDCSVICYLRSKEKERILPRFPRSVKWNSKKWRMILHFSKDWYMMMAGRQYPFSSKEVLDLVRTKLLPQAGFFKKWSEWDNSKINSFKHSNGKISKLFEDYIVIDGTLKPLSTIIEDAPNSLHFNDLLYSNYYSPYYSYRDEAENYLGHLFLPPPHDTRFLVGNAVKCLCCGKEDITISETMRCIHCEEEFGEEDLEGFTECEKCGRRIYYDNTVEVQIGNNSYDYITVCPECAETFYNTCSNCGAYIHNDVTYYDEENNPLCDSCIINKKE